MCNVYILTHLPNLYIRRHFEHTIKLHKNHYEYIQNCEKEKDFYWNRCLDELFNQRRGKKLNVDKCISNTVAISGCQDPWNFNPALCLEACSNITKIRGSYNRGPAAEGLDLEAWSRHYNTERGLAALQRNGLSCPLPCSQVKYQISDVIYREKDKVGWR